MCESAMAEKRKRRYSTQNELYSLIMLISGLVIAVPIGIAFLMLFSVCSMCIFDARYVNSTALFGLLSGALGIAGGLVGSRLVAGTLGIAGSLSSLHGFFGIFGIKFPRIFTETLPLFMEIYAVALALMLIGGISALLQGKFIARRSRSNSHDQSHIHNRMKWRGEDKTLNEKQNNNTLHNFLEEGHHMTLFDVVKMNFARYRTNPVMIVPPLVAMIFLIVTSSLLVPPPTPTTPLVFAPELLTSIFVALGIGLLNSIISFLALLGQASMAGRVVVEGKTRLIDWGKGIKKYFLRVLGIGVIYVAIIGLFFVLMVMVLVFAMLPQLISQLGAVAPPTPPITPQISPLISATTSWVTPLVTTIVSGVFYMWLAPAIIDDKGVFASLDIGTKTMRKGGKLFLSFIALFFAVSACAQSINMLPIYVGITVPSVCYAGFCVTPTHIVSQVITTLFSPLWFLTAFTIYSEQKPTLWKK